MSLFSGIKFSSDKAKSLAAAQSALDEGQANPAATVTPAAPVSNPLLAASQPAPLQSQQIQPKQSSSATASKSTSSNSASLQFAPRRPKPARPPPKVAHVAAPTSSAVVEAAPVLIVPPRAPAPSKTDEVVIDDDGNPVVRAPAMTLAAENDKKKDNSRKRKKKKKRQQQQQIFHEFQPDEDYDPNRPNDLGEYQHYREQVREQRRAQFMESRRRKAAGEAEDSSDYSDSSDEAPRRDAPKMFAPPKSYDAPARRAPLPPPRDATGDDAYARRAAMSGTGDEAYARRLALSQTATGDDAYARRAAMSQAATGDDAYARRAALSQRPPAPARPPPPMPVRPPEPTLSPPPPPPSFRPPTSAVPPFRPPAPAPAPPTFRPPPAHLLAGAPAPFRPPPAHLMAGAPRPPPPGAPSAVPPFPPTIAPGMQPPAGPPRPPPADPEYQKQLEEKMRAAEAVAAKFRAMTEGPPQPKPTPVDEDRGGTFAERMFRKWGHTEGKGLGVREDGIKHALTAEHVLPQGDPSKMSKRQLAKQRAAAANAKKRKWVQAPNARGRIVDANAEVRTQDDLEKYGEVSRVVCLTGAVEDPEEISDDLPDTIGEECSKHGIVERVVLHLVEPPPPNQSDGLRIFVVFSGIAGAWRATRELNGLPFGGQTLRARYFNEDLFNQGARDDDY